nr:uncharacterized protein LOC122271571 isoform X2 [Parasteatoda tepidariorum]
MSGVFQRIIHFKNSSRILINIELRFKKDDIKINSSFKSENFSVTGEKESNHLILLNYFDDFMLHCTVESIDLFINSTCLIFDGNNSCLDCNARSSIRVLDVHGISTTNIFTVLLYSWRHQIL